MRSPMPNDTLSTDPKMKEEARHAASEASNPKPPFDPRVIALEEFDRIIDKRYQSRSFEEVWDLVDTELANRSATLEVLGVFSEAEYRQVTASFFYAVQSMFLIRASEGAKERGEIIHKAALYAAHDRLKIKGIPVQSILADLIRGLVRAEKATPVSKEKCLIHPHGCPAEGEDALQEAAAFGKMFLEVLRNRK
jgi:hypothetical protein